MASTKSIFHCVVVAQSSFFNDKYLGKLPSAYRVYYTVHGNSLFLTDVIEITR